MLERGMTVPASFLLLQCNVMNPQDKVRRNHMASMKLNPSRGIYEEEDKIIQNIVAWSDALICPHDCNSIT